MTKLRLAVFLLSLVVVSTIGTLVYFYARGYRFDIEKSKILPSGLLVANSDPTGAQVIINGELKTATNATISLAPGVYDVVIKKEGFLNWEKRLTIEKEIVTQVDIDLFTSAPSLSALTFSGAFNPTPNSEFSKVAYGIPTSKEAKQAAILTDEKEGLWIIEANNLPIGFSREPRRIADGNLTEAKWEWSPDSREILLTTKNGVFLLDTSSFISQNQRVNVATKVEEIRKLWKEKEDKKLSTKLSKLPNELLEIFEKSATNIVFSPDENKILYLGSKSVKIPQGIIKPLPGSSTQKQEREIKPGSKYVFDIKEDRNFKVADEGQIVYWFPTSRHLVLPQEGKIYISDYDGTNKKEVFSGSYIYPYIFPYSSTSRLLMLTNLGASDSIGNLYSLNLR